MKKTPIEVTIQANSDGEIVLRYKDISINKMFYKDQIREFLVYQDKILSIS